MADKGNEEAAEAFGPITRSATFGKKTYVYKDVDRSALNELGETRRLGLADIFVATVGTGQKERKE